MTVRFGLAHAPLLGLALVCLPAMAQSPIGLLIAGQSRTGFTVQGAGARAMGLGGAFIAVADDATAASFNPAGLALLLKPEVSFVAREIQRKVSYEEYETTSRGKVLEVSDSLVSNHHLDPMLLAGTIPLRVGGNNLALQLSIQRAYALNEGDSRKVTEMPLVTSATSGPTLVQQSIFQSGQIDLYSFAMAYECSERILLGVTFNQWRGRWDLYSDSSQGGDGTDSYINFHQSNSLDGENYNLGLLWRWPTWSLGLVRRTPFRAEYSYATTTGSNLSLPNALNANVPDVGLHWPTTTGLGVAYRPQPHWLVTADVEHTAWSQARFMTDNPALNGVNFFTLSRANQAPDATTFRMGVERLWDTPAGWIVPLRLGFSREPQPVMDPVTRQQRIMYGLALGTGIKQGRYTVDFAYRYGWARRMASQFLDLNQLLAGTQTESVGTERTVEQRADISFMIQFERQPVDRVLHRLFVGD